MSHKAVLKSVCSVNKVFEACLLSAAALQADRGCCMLAVSRSEISRAGELSAVHCLSASICLKGSEVDQFSFRIPFESSRWSQIFLSTLLQVRFTHYNLYTPDL